jgi:alpha-beta hydrolase superfamily lysophospholipase
MDAMRRIAAGACGLAFLVLAAALVRLGSLERGGNAHADLELAGGIPATLYLPQPGEPHRGLPDPLPPAGRPPAIVLCHGFAGDRAMLSTLARRLVASGYAVLALDARGHGENRSAFFPGRGRSDHLMEEFSAAVDFLRASPHVDGARLAVMGHSMGAGAALDYATRDSGLDAAVLISGGWAAEGPYRPPNPLFVYAAGDPPRLREHARSLAARLAENATRAGATPGDPAQGASVRAVEIPGHDHVTILWSKLAALEIVRWLDASFGVTRANDPDLSDPRLAAAGIALLAFLVVAPGIGALAGRIAPPAPLTPATGGVARFAGLVAALALSLPLAAGSVATGFLPLAVARETTQLFLGAGLVGLVGLLVRGKLDLRRLFWRWPRALAAAALACAAVAGLLTPLGVVAHRLALTPERAASATLLALLLFPLFLCLEVSLRRGSSGTALGASVAGRAALLGALVLGVGAGLLPGVVSLLLPTLASSFVLMELVATPLYAASRNVLAIAALESAWLAWIQAASLPILL